MDRGADLFGEVRAGVERLGESGVVVDPWREHEADPAGRPERLADPAHERQLRRAV